MSRRSSGLAYSHKQQVRHQQEVGKLIEVEKVEQVFDMVAQLFLWVEKQPDFVVLKVPESNIRNLYAKMGRRLPEAILTPQELGKRQAKDSIQELRDEEPDKNKKKIIGRSIYE